MIVHCDCRHFMGDRPCAPHKRDGVHCEGCPHYDPLRERILVVKLDAAGDVLRTTCILPGLRAEHPVARIDWLTREDAVPLFENNPAVDRVIPYPGDAVTDLLASDYDLVINLDAAPLSARLAAVARGRRRIGFGYDAAGFPLPLGPEARAWFEMGLFDDVKARNTRTYQEIALAICGLAGADPSLSLHLSDSEKAKARTLAASWGIAPGDPVIGLNTGAGPRWEHKKWTEEGFAELVRLIRSGGGGAKTPVVLLLGGPEEGDRNRRILERSPGGAIDSGTGHSLREFIAIVDICDLVVTGDTMALHIAAALGKKVVALFGPTSASEIELYGRGVKIVSDAPCAGCYRQSCDVRPTCMERIPAADVYRAVVSLP
jgi:heptosyltransferase-2